MKSVATPFNVSSGGIASTTDLSRVIEQKIVDVLVTGKMERPTNPGYGAGLQQLVFDNVGELESADFKTDAAMELSRRITGMRVIDMTVTQDGSSTVTITVLYRTTLSSVRSFTFQVSPGVINEETPI